MKEVIYAALIALVLSMTQGCMLMMAAKVRSIEDLSPEQITALREANMDIYGCFQVGGPPPIGNTTLIIMPKDTMFTRLAFLPNCQIDMR